MNDDGVVDFAVGGRGALVVHGAARSGTVDESAASFTGMRLTAPDSAETRAMSVADIQDVDGDLLPELAVGAPRLEGGTTFLVFGSADALQAELTQPSGQAGFRYTGRDGAGTDVDDAWDGDGDSNLLIGAPTATPAGRAAAGEVLVLRTVERADCYDTLPTSDTDYSWTCDRLGQLYTSREPAVASRSAILAVDESDATGTPSGQDFRLCRRRSEFVCTVAEGGPYGQYFDRRGPIGHVFVQTIVSLGRGSGTGTGRGGGAISASAITRLRGPRLKPRP